MVLKVEVLQVRKQSNEGHNLPTGPSHACQGERSECWRELSKILLDPWDEAGDFQHFNGEFPDVGQRRELASGPVVELLCRKSIVVSPSDKNPRDEGKKAKLGCHPEWPWSLGFIIGIVIGPSGTKSTMKLRYSGAVPGARGGRARQETVGVENEVGDDHVNDLLWIEVYWQGKNLQWGGPARHPRRVFSRFSLEVGTRSF